MVRSYVCAWSTTSRQPTGNKNLMQQPPKQAPNGKLLSCVLGRVCYFHPSAMGLLPLEEEQGTEQPLLLPFG